MLRSVFLLAFVLTAFTVFGQSPTATASTKPNCDITQCQARKASTTTQTATPAPATAQQVANNTTTRPSCQSHTSQTISETVLPARLVSFANQPTATQTADQANCQPKNCDPKACNPAACKGSSTTTLAAKQE